MKEEWKSEMTYEWWKCEREVRQAKEVGRETGKVSEDGMKRDKKGEQRID